MECMGMPTTWVGSDQFHEPGYHHVLYACPRKHISMQLVKFTTSLLATQDPPEVHCTTGAVLSKTW